MAEYSIEGPCIGQVFRTQYGKQNIRLVLGKILRDGNPVYLSERRFGKHLVPDYFSGEIPDDTWVIITHVNKDTSPNEDSGVLFVDCRELQESEIEFRPNWAEVRFEGIRGSKIIVSAWADLCYGDVTVQEKSKQQKLELFPESLRTETDKLSTGEVVYALISPEEGINIEVMIPPDQVKIFPQAWLEIAGGMLAKRVTAKRREKRAQEVPLKRW